MLPLIPFIGTFCEYSLAYLWMRHVKRRTVFGIQLSMFVEDSAQLRALAIRRLALSIPFLIIVRDVPLLEIDLSRRRRVRQVYNGLCVKSFETFSCTALADGTTRVMSAAPEVVCGEGEHPAMVAISILAIIVYVIGIHVHTVMLRCIFSFSCFCLWHLLMFLAIFRGTVRGT